MKFISLFFIFSIFFLQNNVQAKDLLCQSTEFSYYTYSNKGSFFAPKRAKGVIEGPITQKNQLGFAIAESFNTESLYFDRTRHYLFGQTDRMNIYHSSHGGANPSYNTLIFYPQEKVFTYSKSLINAFDEPRIMSFIGVITQPKEILGKNQGII